MKKEITLTVFLNDQVEEIVTTEVEKIAENYGVSFFKSVSKTYEFDELSDDAKKTAIENHRDWNLFHNWYEYTIEMWKERLESIGFEDADISFSGFCSQGDGASFTARCDTQKLLNTLLICQGKHIGDYKKWRLWFELAENGLIKFDMYRKTHQYSHEYTVDGILTEDFSGLNNRMWKEKSPGSFSYWSVFENKTQLRELEESFNYLCLSLFKKIYSDLEEEYYYLQKDEVIGESLQANGFEFDEFGNDA